MESPGCLVRHQVLQPPVGGLGGDSPGHALQRDAQEVEERPDEDKVHGAVPDVHEGEADGAAEEVGEERGWQVGNNRKVDVAEISRMNSQTGSSAETYSLMNSYSPESKYLHMSL